MCLLLPDYVILLRIVLSLNHEESKLETVESVLPKSELPFVMHNFYVSTFDASNLLFKVKWNILL